MKKHLLKILAVAMTIMFFAFSSCDTTSSNVDTLVLKVNGEQYDIDLKTDSVINLNMLTTEFANEFEVVNASDFSSVIVDGNALNDGKCDVIVKNISRDNQIELSYAAGKQKGVVKINTLHDKIPAMVASGRSETPGDFYISHVIHRLVMKCDNEGNVVYYRKGNQGPKDLNGWWDFKKHEYDGKTYYSYHAHDTNFAEKAFFGYNPGMRVILDDKYRQVKTIHLEESRDAYVKKGDALDGHDFYFFSPDHYIVSAYVERDIDGKTYVVSYLQEVKDGEVVFDWWSNDHAEMMTWRDKNFEKETAYDYVHFNSIQVLPDGNWLCSFRHLCSVLKIDRANGTGDIIWRVAGADLKDEYSFYGQHYATLHDDNSLVLFDNGNGHNPPVTRVMNLEINPKNGKVKGGGNVLAGNDAYFSIACGSAQKIGGHYVIGWGAPGNQEGEFGRLVTEVNADGNETFRLAHTSEFIPSAAACTYRCVKY